MLGICVGMQLLFESSEEGEVPCLGLLPGRVRRFADRDDLPVPHMGWNQLEFEPGSPLLKDIQPGDHVYFVHSYSAPVSPLTVATASVWRAILRPGPERQRVRRPVPPGTLGAHRLVAAA